MTSQRMNGKLRKLMHSIQVPVVRGILLESYYLNFAQQSGVFLLRPHGSAGSEDCEPMLYQIPL